MKQNIIWRNRLFKWYWSYWR